MVDCDHVFDGEKIGTDYCKQDLRKVSERSVHCMRSLLARAVMLLVLMVYGR